MLVYSTYLGGTDDNSGTAVALDAESRAVVMGDTSSGDFPTTPGVFDPSYNGGNCGGYRCADVLYQAGCSNVVAPIEQPLSRSFITNTVTLSGFAIDLASPTGTGIDRVHIYLDGPYGTGTIIGGAPMVSTGPTSPPSTALAWPLRLGAGLGHELAWPTVCTNSMSTPIALPTTPGRRCHHTWLSAAPITCIGCRSVIKTCNDLLVGGRKHRLLTLTYSPNRRLLPGGNHETLTSHRTLRTPAQRPTVDSVPDPGLSGGLPGTSRGER